jgi:hypothetical protein
LDKVSHILCDSGSIKFFRLPLNESDEETLFEAWYFKDEETALESWENMKSKLGTINLEPL